MKRCATILFLILLAYQLLAQENSWRWQNPLPQGNTLRAVHAFNAQEAIGVGYRCVKVQTNDSGANWQAASFVNNATVSAYDLSFINDQNGWLAGDSGLTAKTSDGGGSWQTLNSGTETPLQGVYFINGQIGWAVGNDGVIIATADGGASWSAQTSGASDDLQDVFFFDATTGVAGGRYGTILRTTDGGAGWNPQTSNTDHMIKTFYFINADTGWAGCSWGTYLRTYNGGQTWIAQDLASREHINSIFFIDKTTGWLCTESGSVYKSTSGGTAWIKQSITATDALYDIQFTSSDTGWVCGRDEHLFKSTDGGETWQLQALPAGAEIWGLNFPDAQHGWIVGTSGTVLAYSGSPAVGIKPDKRALPQSFILWQNYPNPFNPQTVIGYQLSAASKVRLVVYNMLGQRINVLIDGRQNKGMHIVKFNGENLSSGVYFYRLQTEYDSLVRTMVLLR